LLQLQWEILKKLVLRKFFHLTKPLSTIESTSLKKKPTSLTQTILFFFGQRQIVPKFGLLRLTFGQPGMINELFRNLRLINNAAHSFSGRDNAFFIEVYQTNL
jgi:hypothetical protein